MLRRCVVLLLLVLAIAEGQTPGRAQSPDALKFFKNYFGNIDYATGGVSLLGTGVNGLTPPTPIPMSGVPANADILAAFLYWETVITKNQGSATAGATFRGYDVSTIAVELNPAGTAPCWSSGGGAGGAEGAHKMKAFRADVLRFLPVPTDGNGNPIGKRLVNDTDLISNGFDLHTVTLPDSGTGNQVPATTGASLVVVYRDPNAAGPMRSIVIYNGGYTMDQNTDSMTQTIQGFYQASTTSPVAKMTQIVGDGQANFSERLMFGDNLLPLQQLDSLNPFQSGWENKTFENLPLSGGASSAVVSVDHEGFTPFDCLSWGAIIFSTTVQDTDLDGLLDIWESTTDTLYDPNNQPLPNLKAMGANPNVKDVFVEVGYMKTTSAYTNPAQGLVDVHDHLPAELAVTMVGDAFKNAPVKNPYATCGLPSQLPCGPTGIKVHFDVGNNYQTNPYVIPWSPGPSSLARGGEFIDEADTQCDPAVGTCLFPAYPGTVGWKTGFWQYRDQPLTHANEADCLAAGIECVRRFDRARKDIFHYTLFAHALGVSRAPVDDPTTPGIDETVTPRTNTGIADAPGGDILMTLGFFDEHVGTPFIQATTLMHELGHNLGLRHGGIPFQPNCKPNYQSVMNYLFQVRGLMVGTANLPVAGNQVGVPVIDYSRQSLGPLTENSLNEPAGLGASWLYRTRWYAPFSSSFLDQSLQTTPATKHCDGSPIIDAAEMVRVDGTTIGSPPGIDWDADGMTDTATPPQDVTFNGTITSLDAGVNDWAIVDLRQVGTRRNVSSPGSIEGALSLDLGQGEWGQGEWGQGEWGQGEWGQGEWGDLGQGEWGQGEWGQGEWGAGRIDLDLATATALGNAPNELKLTSLKQGVRANWKKPHVGSINVYEVYRVTGTGVTVNTLNTKVLVGIVPAPATTVIDTTVKKNVTYTYFVIAVFDDYTRSGVSNFATITYK
jgi:hypothetical protein